MSSLDSEANGDLGVIRRSIFRPMPIVLIEMFLMLTLLISPTGLGDNRFGGPFGAAGTSSKNNSRSF